MPWINPLDEVDGRIFPPRLVVVVEGMFDDVVDVSPSGVEPVLLSAALLPLFRKCMDIIFSSEVLDVLPEAEGTSEGIAIGPVVVGFGADDDDDDPLSLL